MPAPRPDWPAELRWWTRLTRRLPRWPKMLGLANHVARRAWLRRPRDPVLADVLGLQMVLDPAELTEGLLLFAPHLFDRHEVAALHQVLQPGDTFLDLGAHVGFYALVAARRVGPTGRVLAVEPEPRSRALLAEHLRRNGLDAVEVLDVAVSDRDEERILRLGPPGNRGASGFLRQDGEEIPVRCRPVAALLSERGITEVAAAKLDLEGFEARVLHAWLSPLPPSARPRLLIVEHHGTEVLALLSDLGYRWERGSRHNVIARRDP